MLWEFDRELSRGDVPDWECCLGQCRDSTQTAELLRAMISTEIDYVGWDAERVKTRVRFCARYDRSKAAVLGLVRGVYADLVKGGARPLLSEFEALGYPMSQLRLRVEAEPIYLGQVIVERFRVEQRVAKGSFGVVYRAFDLVEDRLVAVKTIHGLSRVARTRAEVLLRQEATALEALKHPGIPSFIGVFERTGHVPCLVREFVDGGNLRDLAGGRPVAPTRAASLIAQVADALHCAHRGGFIHRDLSPANVLVDAADHAYLTDFGIALSVEQQVKREGETGGTRGYMPTENLLGMTAHLDGRSDTWALGAILFELLTGQSLSRGDAIPLWGTNLDEFLENILAELMPAEYPSQISAGLDDICERCIALEPNRRHVTAGALASKLRGFLRNESFVKNSPAVDLAESRLNAWRLGVRIGIVTAWHSRASAMIMQLEDERGSNADTLRWLLMTSQCFNFSNLYGMSGHLVTIGEHLLRFAVGHRMIERAENGQKHRPEEICRLRSYVDEVKVSTERVIAPLVNALEKCEVDVYSLFEVALGAALCVTSGCDSTDLEQLQSLASSAKLENDSIVSFCKAMCGRPRSKTAYRVLQRL